MGYAYVAARADDRLSIYDVTDPTNPTLEANISGGGAEPWLGSSYGVFVLAPKAVGIAGLNPALMEVLR